jgi:hypothetical protein
MCLQSNTHVVLATLKRAQNDMSSYQRKMFKVDDHMGIAIAGLTADGRVLCKYMRNECINHRCAGATMQQQLQHQRHYSLAALAASANTTGCVGANTALGIKQLAIALALRICVVNLFLPLNCALTLVSGCVSACAGLCMRPPCQWAVWCGR